MKLYERGKFQLDDPLEMYAPEFADQKVYAGLDDAGQPKYEAPKRKITLRDVMRHTAGFMPARTTRPRSASIFSADSIRAPTPTRCPSSRRSSRRCRWPTSPARAGCIRNAVDVQAYLVQKISGVPFDKFLELHIFKPLGMTTTRYTILPTDPDRPQLAAMYTRNDDGTFTRQTDEEAYKFNGQAWPLKPGNFGLVSTIDDYMKFARMLLGGGKLGRARILKPETVQLMATDAMPPEVTDKLVAAVQGPGGLRHRFRGARRATQGCERGFRRGRRILLGWRGQHPVLGRPEERHRRGAVHADAARSTGCTCTRRSATPCIATIRVALAH